MKRLFLFLILSLFLLVISSCSKDVEHPANKAKIGEWQWVYSTGGLSNDTLAPGNNTLLTLSLDNDSTYVIYLNNEPQVSGSYSIQATTNMRVLHFDHSIQISILELRPEQAIIKWDDNQLQLLDYSISNGFNHHFKKI